MNNDTAKPKKTYAEVHHFINAAGAYVKESKENFLTRAIQKLRPALTKIMDQYNELADEIDRKYCTVSNDEYKTILRDEKTGGYRFTVENQGKRNKEINQLLLQTVEIPSHIPAPDRQPKLTLDQKTHFYGFIIPEPPADPEDAATVEAETSTVEMNGSPEN